MKKKRNLIIGLLLAALLVGICSVAAMCSPAQQPDPTQPSGSEPAPAANQLAAPVVRVEEDGTVTWQRVEGADRYEVYVNGVLASTTEGFVYMVETQQMGEYRIWVVAVDSTGSYAGSDPSQEQIYIIEKTKLSTPVPSFDGYGVVWDVVENADGYQVYLDNELLPEAEILRNSGREMLCLKGLDCGAYTVEIRAVSSDGSFRDSEISDPVTYYQADQAGKWGVDAAWDRWQRSTDIAIMRIIQSDITVWVDVRGAQTADFENFVEIPAGAEAFYLTGYRPSAYGAMAITLSLRTADGEYEDVVVDAANYILAEDTEVEYYYWELPEKFRNGNVFVRVSMESSGAYQAQFVLRSFGFSENTEYEPLYVPVNQPVTLSCVGAGRMIKYNTEKGFLTLADNYDMPGDCALMFVPAEDVGYGYYRIKTQNGLYLTRTTYLSADNVGTDYIVGTEYSTSLNQVWFARHVKGTESAFTILSYGSAHEVYGLTEYYVLNGDANLEGVHTWHDIPHVNLQFWLGVTSADFADTENFIQTSALDLSQPVLASFVGRNTVLADRDGNMVLGSLLNQTPDPTPYAWRFIDAGNGYYYIKTQDGMYLCASNEGGTFFVVKGYKAENDSRYLWSLKSRGGDMFYLGNKYAGESTGMELYMVYDWITERLAFYTDLLAHGDEVLRLRNIQAPEVPDAVYVPPAVPVGQGVAIQSIGAGSLIKYNTEKGFLTHAEAGDTAADCALMLVPATEFGEGFYRIKTQNGLYITRATYLNEANVGTDYMVAAPYDASPNQIWMTRYVAGTRDAYTIMNYGGAYDDGGVTRYYVLNGDASTEGITTWFDISHTNLQFRFVATQAEFADAGTFIPAAGLDLSKHVIASFAGRNTVLTDVGGAMVPGGLLSDIPDPAPYAWRFVDAGNGSYYIQTQDGMYLYAAREGNAYFVMKGYKAENDSSYLWQLHSRGGNLYYLANAHVTQDSGLALYADYDWITNRLSFYTDLLTHGDQVLRLKNVEAQDVEDATKPPIGIPVNQGVAIQSIGAGSLIKYNTEKGFLTHAEAGDTEADCALMFVPATELGGGFYRIKTQDGLYITRATFLNAANVGTDYMVAAPYDASPNQIWMTRLVEGTEDTYTIMNYGGAYDDGGVTRYYVLNGDASTEGITTWFDIPNYNLQFRVTPTTASFDGSGTFTPSTALNLQKHVVASFAGRNTVLTDTDGAMTLGGLLSDTADTVPFAWKFQEAGNGSYYIKTRDGMYLYAAREGNAYFVMKGYKAENDSSYLWQLHSRGGNLFYMTNSFVAEDSRMQLYMDYDWITNRLSFYSDLLINGDQVLRFVNVDCQEAEDAVEPTGGFPVNRPVVLRSVGANSDIQYNTEKGFLTHAPAGASEAECAVMFVPATELGDGFYRIKTPDGMYLTRATLLNPSNIAADYMVAAPYNATANQIWLVRLVEGTEDTYTIMNYGGAYDDGGVTRYYALNGDASTEGITTWYDIPSYDLQFQVRLTTASFAASGSFTQSPTLNLQEPVLASFVGRNTVLTDSNGAMTLGGLLSDTADTDPYTWKFQEAGNGSYYIQTRDGMYLYATREGSNYFVMKGEKAAGDSRYLWQLHSRGGNLFCLSNSFVAEDSRMQLYVVYDWITTRLSFYTDLLISGDQVLRLTAG